MAEPRADGDEPAGLESAPGAADPGEIDPGELAARLAALAADNAQLFALLERGERRFRRLAKAVWQVQEDERRRLARDLHDDLGQVLTALKIQLDLLHRELDRGEPPQGEPGAAAAPRPAERLAGGIALASEALAKTRRLAHLLRPQVLDDLGLAPALSWLARNLGESTGLAVTLDLVGLDERLDPEIETLVFRLAQEALTNALKHSGVSAATVRAERSDRRLRIEIEDRGRGFDPRPSDSGIRQEGADPGHAGPGSLGQGFGLTGMRERVALFGGRLTVTSAVGAGTRVLAELPLGAADERTGS